MAVASETRTWGRPAVRLGALMGLALLVLGSACADTEEPAPARPGGAKRWTHVEFVEHYAFDGPVLEDEDLSGIACVSPTRCLVGADEGHAVQVLALSRTERTLRVLGTVNLLNPGDEIDIEAIAAEGDSYYITGSHGVAKKSGNLQGSRYRLFRLRVDPATGLPMGTGAPVTTLGGILRDDPVLGAHFAKPLQQQGVNIEGLAIRNGRLYAGLRNPNLNGYAHVLEVGADEVFATTRSPRYVLHRLPLGRGLGIRELVATRRGLLIIAGNAGSEPSAEHPDAVDYDEKRGYWLFRWDGVGSDVDKIGLIPNAPGKAEAMTVLDESEDAITVLILFDGAENGRPSVYRIY